MAMATTPKTWGFRRQAGFKTAIYAYLLRPFLPWLLKSSVIFYLLLESSPSTWFAIQTSTEKHNNIKTHSQKHPPPQKKTLTINKSKKTKKKTSQKKLNNIKKKKKNSKPSPQKKTHLRPPPFRCSEDLLYLFAAFGFPEETPPAEEVKPTSFVFNGDFVETRWVLRGFSVGFGCFFLVGWRCWGVTLWFYRVLSWFYRVSNWF